VEAGYAVPVSVDFDAVARVCLPACLQALESCVAEKRLLHNINVHFFIQDGEPSISLILDYQLDDEDTIEISDALGDGWAAVAEPIAAAVTAELEDAEGTSESVARFILAVDALRSELAGSVAARQLNAAPGLSFVLRDEFGFDFDDELLADMRAQLGEGTDD